MSPAALLSCPLLVLLPLLSRLLSGFRCSGCCALRMRRAGLGHHHLHHRRQYSWCKVETEGVRLFRVCREFVSESCRSFFFFYGAGGSRAAPQCRLSGEMCATVRVKCALFALSPPGPASLPAGSNFRLLCKVMQRCVCVRWSRDTDEPLHP